MRRAVVAGAVAAAIAIAYFMLGRGYPWQLAVMVGGGVGALVFSSLRTGAQLRSLRRRDEP